MDTGKNIGMGIRTPGSSQSRHKQCHPNNVKLNTESIAVINPVYPKTRPFKDFKLSSRTE